MKRNPQQQELHDAILNFQMRGSMADRERLLHLSRKLVSKVVSDFNIEGMERDDLMSVAYLAILRSAGKYRDHKYPYVFLCTAMRNDLLSEAEKAKTKSRSAMSTVYLEDFQHRGSTSESAGECDHGALFASNVIRLDQIAFGRQVHEFIHRHCDPMQVRIMELITEGYSQTEVGEELGMERWQIGNEVRKIRAAVLRRFGRAYD